MTVPLSGVVWTHCGNAHLDDLFAVAVVDAYVIPVKEIRRVKDAHLNPSPGDIVVDIGNRHAVENGVYYLDHHQDKNTRCSAWLVGMELAKEVFNDPVIRETLEIIDTIDRKGIIGLESLFHMGPEQRKFTRSLVFIMEIVVWEFEQRPLQAMRQVSRVLKERHKISTKANAVKAQLEKDSLVQEINGVKILIVPSPQQLGVNADLAQVAQALLARDKKIDVICCWDDRNSNGARRIFLPEIGQTKIDLTRIKNNENVAFCHARNFLINLKEDVTLDVCIDLIREAIR